MDKAISMSKYAILSVTNKNGIVEFANGLLEKGYKILTSGGTGKLLSENGIEIMKISEYTGFDEILNGRVKTLHPKIHAGILSKRTKEHQAEMDEAEYENIDLVVCNLYEFSKAVNSLTRIDEIIEHIDIGGPTLIRAAAKNFKKVTVLTDPNDYTRFLESEEITELFNLEMATKAFNLIATYDIDIAKYFGKTLKVSNHFLTDSNFDLTYYLYGEKYEDLRYGENSHQKASVYKNDGNIFYNHIHGPKVSYNNILDLIAGLDIIDEFREPSCAIIKHRTPCGVAINENILDAYRNALASDKLSAFGGVYCFNREIDEGTAKELVQMFVDTIIAPSYTSMAFDILKSKEKMTILERRPVARVHHEITNIPGGFVIQNKDIMDLKNSDCKVVTSKPDNEAYNRAIFAWKVVKNSRSNAIVIASENATLGIGSGETSRVDATRLALERAGEKAKGAVMASDAFFPFADSVELAAMAGVKTIIVPKGSIRDQLSVDKANEFGITLIHTNYRAFKH